MVKEKELVGYGYMKGKKVDTMFYVFSDGTRKIRERRTRHIMNTSIEAWVSMCAKYRRAKDLGDLREGNHDR